MAPQFATFTIPRRSIGYPDALVWVHCVSSLAPLVMVLSLVLPGL